MRLALQTDYALRTLMYLAAQETRATVDEVAGLFGISRAHVAKVVNQLSRLGFIRSIRGVGGGIELSRSPGDIAVGEVIKAFEGNMHLLDCTGSDGVCVIESFCKLKTVLSEAERIQIEYLNSVTLEQVLPTKRQVQQIGSAT
jgi:Rrf2 family nitric oxide-sensitive transcriptional repressor